MYQEGLSKIGRFHTTELYNDSEHFLPGRQHVGQDSNVCLAYRSGIAGFE